MDLKLFLYIKYLFFKLLCSFLIRTAGYEAIFITLINFETIKDALLSVSPNLSM